MLIKFERSFSSVKVKVVHGFIGLQLYRIYVTGVVVFDGTAPEKTGPKDGTKFCGPRKMLQT